MTNGSTHFVDCFSALDTLASDEIWILLSAVVLVVATCIAYAVDLFTVSGGVLIVPGDATVVGLVVAVGIGYRSSGSIFAWILLFATGLGYHADWAFFGLSGRGLSGKLAFFFDPVSLVVVAPQPLSPEHLRTVLEHSLTGFWAYSLDQCDSSIPECNCILISYIQLVLSFMNERSLVTSHYSYRDVRVHREMILCITFFAYLEDRTPL
jgi:hypothetical protein